jgi:transcriptional regulator with XRE-family HTH domain
VPPLTFKQQLGARIRELREARGWNQDDLGPALNKILRDGGERPQGTISRWEIGQTAPDPAELAALASVLECTTDYLLGRTPYPQPFPAGHFLVDEIAYEEYVKRGRLPRGKGWFAAIPSKQRVCSPSEFEQLARALELRLAGRRR